MNPAPLILVTRPDGDLDPLVAVLRAAGYAVAAIPMVATRPVDAGGSLDDAARRLDAWDWVVVTSRVGVRALAAAAARAGRPIVARPAISVGRGQDRPRWAAVGPATAAALESIGVRADVVAAEPSGRGIARALEDAGPLTGARVLLARADAASTDLPTALQSFGAAVDEVVAYHTIEGPAEVVDELAAVLGRPGLAAVVVASGSAARGLVNLAARARAGERVLRLPMVVIGPSTAAVARSLGFERVHDAAEPSLAGLVAAVARAVPWPSTLSVTPPEFAPVEVPS